MCVTWGIFILLSIIHFQICAFRHATLNVKIRALLCFLNGFGISVPVFSNIKNIQFGHQLHNRSTRLWPNT